MKQLGIGISGCGFISDYHLRALATVQEARVIAVTDRNEGRAKAAAERYAVPHVEASFGALLERTDVDAVLILTPNHLHHEQARLAAEAGKHVMVQKPFARNLAEAETMVSVARERAVVLAPSFMHRFTIEARTAKQYLEDGAIGRPTSMRIRNAVLSATWASWFYDPVLSGGGAVIDVGIHGVDLVRYLLGDIVEVTATLHTAEPKRAMDDGEIIDVPVEDNASLTYLTSVGAIVSHDVSWTQRVGAKRFSFELYGEEGAIFVRQGEAPLAIASAKTGGVDAWFVPELPNEPFGFAQHRAFAGACLGYGDVNPVPEDGVAAMKVVEAAYTAARERRPVNVGP